jgi:hypothetical protein
MLTSDAQDGGFVLTCLEVPAVITQGDDMSEALQLAAAHLTTRASRASSISSGTLESYPEMLKQNLRTISRAC